MNMYFKKRMTALAPPDLRPMEMEKRRPPFATRSNVSRRCGRRRKFPLAFNGVVNARTFGLSFVSTRLFQNGQGTKSQRDSIQKSI